MTETETRLRDYLQAKASTVPDDVDGPGLPTTRPRSRAGVPLVAAAAVVAVVIASVAHLSGPQRLAPAEQPTDLGVPYVLMTDKGQRTLYDNGQTVKLDENTAGVLGRVSGGWAITYTTSTSLHLGVLAADGSVRTIGPAADPGIARPALSPDHTQVAVALGQRVQVYDVASGRALADRTMPYAVDVHGWNQAGIWSSKSGEPISNVAAWQPAADQLTPVTLPKLGDTLDVSSRSAAILAVTRPNQQTWCVTFLERVGGRLSTGPVHCEPTPIHPLISPDGSTVALSRQNVLVDVVTGKQTPLQLGQAPRSDNILTFEDSEHVLVVNSIREDGSPAPTTTPPPTAVQPPATLPRDTVYRCVVASGACEKLLAAPDGTVVELIKP